MATSEQDQAMQGMIVSQTVIHAQGGDLANAIGVLLGAITFACCQCGDPASAMGSVVSVLGQTRDKIVERNQVAADVKQQVDKIVGGGKCPGR